MSSESDEPRRECPPLDIAANRRARKWSAAELMGRGAWEVLEPLLFRLSPRQFWAWRRWVLRAFGARIGRRVHIHPRVRIAVPWNLEIGDDAAIGDGAILYSLGAIKVGLGATVSQYAHICAGSHDYAKADMPLLKSPITIGAGAWVCADAFVGPGVSIGDFAIVAARAVTVNDVGPWTIVGGTPAREIGRRQPLEGK